MVLLKKSSMPVIMVFLLVVITGSCGISKSVDGEENVSSLSSTTFDYLQGNWKRRNEKVDRETFEHWTKNSDSEYIGFGYTLKNRDTIWQEHIVLSLSNVGWEFKVTGKVEEQPTVFRLTEINNEGFTAENPENEFPKKIVYAKSGDKLNAVISGDDMEIPFVFDRIDK